MDAGIHAVRQREKGLKKAKRFSCKVPPACSIMSAGGTCIMKETRYLISETAKLVQVEPHVLRYWEEELGLSIKRNEMGHRYYTDKDLEIFQKIKELKKEGLQLRMIKEKIHEGEQPPSVKETGISDEAVSTQRETGYSTERIQVKIVTPQKFLPEQPSDKREEKQERKSDRLTKEERFQVIMERLIHDIELKERKEGRYRRLDEAIRRHQQSRKMVAATQENRKKKK